MRKPMRKAAAVPEPRFLDDYLPYLMAHAAFLISGQFQNTLAAKGIRFSVWRLLATLSGTNGMTIGEIAEDMLVQQPTVTRIVDRLEADGLVARQSSTGDRRQVIVVLTARGRSTATALIKDAEQHQNEVLSGYSKAEVGLLFQVMRKVLERGDAP